MKTYLEVDWRLSLFLLSLETTSLVTSNYSAILDTGNDQFCRVGNCSTSGFYYQAFGFNVSIAGSYSFQSISSIDTFGYIYNTKFLYPTPSPNIVASNNDGAGNMQFRLYLLLDTKTPYVLVVTTFNPNVIVSFSIVATGLASVTFTPINMSGKSSIFFRALHFSYKTEYSKVDGLKRFVINIICFPYTNLNWEKVQEVVSICENLKCEC